MNAKTSNAQLDLAQPPRATGRPKASELADLEARLLYVAREMFFAKGYGGTTMHAVALAARVSKTTLYSRYPTKEALFRAIVAEQIESWNSGVNQTPIPEDVSIERLLLIYGDVALRAGASRDYIQINR